jgi:TetR/AcrR family transcriptional regulator, transcriptional repressor for nem operon
MPRPSVRDKLIAAAVDAFQTRGYKACTIEDIADRAKVFKGSFYNHFKSKEALAVEVVRLYDKKLADSLLNDAESPMRRLRLHFDFMLAQYQRFGFRGCLLGNLTTEVGEAGPALRTALVRAFDRWCGRVTEVLRQAQAAGEIKNVHDPEALARYLVNSWEGATTRLKLVKNQEPMDDFFALALGSLLGYKK